MKDPKNIALILIPYLTICGALYQVSYWDTFDINGLAFITVSDIIKSSVYPVFSAAVCFFIGLIFGQFGPLPKLMPPGEGRNTSLGKRLNSDLGRSLLLILLLCLIIILIYFGKHPERWLIIAFCAGIPLHVYLDRSGILLDAFASYKLRLIFLQAIVYLPIFSFAVGKYNGEIISKNIKFKYIVSTAISAKTECTSFDTLKFLGSTENHFIFIDLQDKHTLFLKTDRLDTLIFKDKK